MFTSFIRAAAGALGDPPPTDWLQLGGQSCGRTVLSGFLLAHLKHSQISCHPGASVIPRDSPGSEPKCYPWVGRYCPGQPASNRGRSLHCSLCYTTFQEGVLQASLQVLGDSSPKAHDSDLGNTSSYQLFFTSCLTLPSTSLLLPGIRLFWGDQLTLSLKGA